MKILFVCTGNTCRSPMAQGLFRNMAPEHECSSAGLSALPGQPASPQAAACCKELGVDISPTAPGSLRVRSCQNGTCSFP